MAIREMVRHLGVSSEQRPALRKQLRALAAEGVLVKVHARYALPESLQVVQGTFRGNQAGYGFVILDTGGDEAEEGLPTGDVFIGRRWTCGAMDGDRVTARVDKSFPDGRREGRVLEIRARAHKTLVGRLEVDQREAWVDPQNQRIPCPVFVSSSGRNGAKAGELVEVKITRYPRPRENARGQIIRSFGYPEDPAAELSMIVSKYGLREAFPEKALAEAEAFQAPSEDEPFPGGVEDLRDLVTFTIDPRTARDRDDAISIEGRPGGGWRLGVHIADVSHYVRRGTALDKEALLRGNSVYFPERAIPMLPPKLSSDICSLNSDACRRTLSMFLDFNAQGERSKFRFTLARIRSRAQLTYAGAGAVLEDREIEETAEIRAAASLENEIRALAALAEKLHARRTEGGSLDFDLPEAYVLLGPKGEPVAIARAPRNTAHRLVEECMLAANRAVADCLEEAEGAAVYRVHDPPDEEKLHSVRVALSNMGLPVPPSEKLKRPGSLQGVLDAVLGKETERFVNLLVLRSMKLATYEAAPSMHFGLGFDRYTHFTSPIRRYADLLVHRRLKQLMRGERGEPDKKRLAKTCAEISKAERSAEAAEREMVDFHKAVFMKKRIGERFAGHVSGVTAFGIFIELDEVFVGGMVPLALMTDDYYSFLPEMHAVLGERTGRRLRLGDPVTVRIEDVDLGQRRVTFQLLSGGSRVVGTEESGIRRRGRQRGMRRPAKARETASAKAFTKGGKTLKRNRTGLKKRARRK